MFPAWSATACTASRRGLLAGHRDARALPRGHRYLVARHLTGDVLLGEGCEIAPGASIEPLSVLGTSARSRRERWSSAACCSRRTSGAMPSCETASSAPAPRSAPARLEQETLVADGAHVGRARCWRARARALTWSGSAASTCFDRARRVDLDLVHRVPQRGVLLGTGRRARAVERWIDNSLCFGLYDGKRQVGFARVVTDRAAFAWLADVRASGPPRPGTRQVAGRDRAGPDLQQLRRFFLGTADAHSLSSVRLSAGRSHTNDGAPRDH